jgi:cupin superfamily acireductone dioxygenase involved in methionine salvage
MIRPDYQLKLNWDYTWQMDRPHFHEDIEILLSLSGSGSFLLGNEIYPLQEGTLFIISEGTLHKCITSQSYKRY